MVLQAIRAFRKSPGFSATVLLTLALGIGGSTAIFSVVNGVLLRPLPYPDPDRIVEVMRTRAGTDEPGSHAPAEFLDVQRENRSLVHLAGYRGDVLDITSAGAEPVRMSGAHVTASFFDAFGMPAALGRAFGAATNRPGEALLVISDSAWRKHFGGDRRVAGRTVRVNGQPHVLTAVMPPGFVWPEGTEAWTLSPLPVPPSPVDRPGDLLAQRDVRFFGAVARLRPGVSLSQASDDLSRVAATLAERYQSSQGHSFRVTPIREALVGQSRQGLLLLLAAVGCLLLIACTNVAGLLVARGAGRSREVGIRTALGAKRGRIVRQLLTESVLLSLAGGALGLLVAAWATDALVAVIPDSIPRLGEVGMDARVALFAVSVSVVTGILFGLAPALQTSRESVIDMLHAGGRAVGSASTRRLRAVLVAAEVALALVLLVTAGLMIASFVRLRAVDPGYRLEQVVTAGVALPGGRYGTGRRQSAFYKQLLERLESSPSTGNSAVVFPRPFSESGGQVGFELDDAAPLPDRERPQAHLGIASPKAFAALGVPLLAGRAFTESDVEGAPAVVIVNQAFVRKHWPGQNPVGKRITLNHRLRGDTPDWQTVVGVVGDTRPRSLDVAPQPTLYFSYHQFRLPFMSLVIRGTDDPAPVERALRAAVRGIDPDLPIEEVKTLASIASQSAAQPRFRTYVLAAFAAISLMLAAIGVYGLLSYSVTQRVREIGVRMALGAKPRDVLRLVVGEGMRLVAAGAALGVAGALATSRLVSAMLFGVSAADPLTYGAVVMILAAVAFIACYIPALRAARVDPISALRAE
jgi:predicted permease